MLRTMHPDSAAPTQPLSTHQVRAFFAAHRTIRRYQPYAMPADDLDTILYAAQRAPTDATAQLYSFVRLSDPAARQQAAALTQNPHLATASESFVVCLDMHRLAALLRAGGYEAGVHPHVSVHFGIGDAALAGQNMLIAAEMLGYQGCWVGGVLSSMEAIVALLALPAGVLPYAALTIGKAAEYPAQRPRLPRELVVHENSYRQPSTQELLEAAQTMNPIAARGDTPGDWLRLLGAYFGKDRAMDEREPHLRAALRQQALLSED